MPASEAVKCLVWDLDNTLWKGILLEDVEIVEDPLAARVIKELDNRGILNSIASRNEIEPVQAKLSELGLWEYFLAPQVSWNTKASSIKRIADELNIGVDSLAFIDDDEFERDEVRFSYPQVRTYSPPELAGILGRPEFSPDSVTEESTQRRQMYVAARRRDEDERSFEGPKEEFLEGLGMKLTISEASESDLGRAEELTLRTNQLNTTGRTYAREELSGFISSPNHLLLVASLEDSYGAYGKIGLALVEKRDDWILRLLLMSCRVMSRGVGSVLLNHVMRISREADVRLLAEFVPNDRNRMMLVTFRFAGFSQVSGDEDLVILESTREDIPEAPPYMDVLVK